MILKFLSEVFFKLQSMIERYLLIMLQSSNRSVQASYYIFIGVQNGRGHCLLFGY